MSMTRREMSGMAETAVVRLNPGKVSTGGIMEAIESPTM
jgi:hypothetical protein